MDVSPRAVASFLTFRWLVEPDLEWLPGVKPKWPRAEADDATAVRTAADIRAALTEQVAAAPADTGILLSGGIDSAILAALVPKRTLAFTVEFSAPGAMSEAPAAGQFARALGLEHHVVRVSWEDHLRTMGSLCRAKSAPLHPVEVGLHLAARAARAQGLGHLIVGNGADSSFGGLDRLLSREWTVNEFAARYTFVEPKRGMRQPVELPEVYARYVRPDGRVDVESFLRNVHGPGITQAFDNALTAAGVKMIEPYERLRLGEPLDLQRVRAGESKYLLRELFSQLYAGLASPEKVAFARPMQSWLATWRGPDCPELRSDVGSLDGEQRWLLFCLEHFLCDLRSR